MRLEHFSFIMLFCITTNIPCNVYPGFSSIGMNSIPYSLQYLISKKINVPATQKLADSKHLKLHFSFSICPDSIQIPIFKKYFKVVFQLAFEFLVKYSASMKIG